MLQENRQTDRHHCNCSEGQHLAGINVAGKWGLGCHEFPWPHCSQKFVVWAELLVLQQASSPPGKDWVRRAMRGNCTKTWQITAATCCFRNYKKLGNTRLVPLYLLDCHAGKFVDSNNPILQPSPNLVGLKGNQFKFYKKTALPVGKQQLPARCTESCSIPQKEVNLSAQPQLWLVAQHKAWSKACPRSVKGCLSALVRLKLCEGSHYRDKSVQGLFGYKKEHIMSSFKKQHEECRLEQSVVFERHQCQ